ncbi:DUF2249 domain-containing protein [Natronolimnobius baerhuensis]|nr:DUF2249 domain-containing protein [Natronolimnobius baerhuensis]
MTTNIDLRDHPTDEYHTHLSEPFTAADPGDQFEITTERDIDPSLIRSQLEHDRALEWEYIDQCGCGGHVP